MGSFGTWVLLVVLWHGSGAIDRPIARTFDTSDACNKAQAEIEDGIAEQVAANSPALRMSYDIPVPCRFVLNESLARAAAAKEMARLGMVDKHAAPVARPPAAR